MAGSAWGDSTWPVEIRVASRVTTDVASTTTGWRCDGNSRGCWSVELWLNCPDEYSAELETDHHDHSMMTSNRASNCPHCPGPGNESVGPLAQAYMFLLTGAAENAGRSGVASFLFPTTGAEAEGSVVLADDNQPMTGDRWCFLVETGCPTNGSWRMIHRLGCLTWYPPGPGTAGGRTSGG